ncbi:hypothetical protein ACHAXA_011890 [Cyclostephanos tholiformis]|uniref:Cytochrome b5 heme-binding domain-containing protein n=1 Tax=Cyclostephanos tholiformis TaxID=382380 RepID=A0ABD3SCQ6_9STRA
MSISITKRGALLALLVLNVVVRPGSCLPSSSSRGGGTRTTTTPGLVVLVVSAVSFASTMLSEVVAAPNDVDDDSSARECAGPGTCVVDGEGGGDDGIIAAGDATGVGLGADDAIPSTPTRYAVNGDRLITAEELSLHTTTESRIWLSILGRVYDVTDGEDFYGALKGGYKFYAGRDASPCFSTGHNTPEGAEERMEEWEVKKQLGVYEWAIFYEKHEKYQFLGVLVGSRYYDVDGNETELRKTIVEKCSEAKKIADEEKERKKLERMAAREARKLKLKK